MRSKLRGWVALGTTLLVAGVLASACGGDDDGGGASGTGGKDGGSGGSTGGVGGIGGSTGGVGGGKGGSGGNTGGSGGCLPAPDPNDADACSVCQDAKHAECACKTELSGCVNDKDCAALWDCVIDGDADAGIAACPTSFSVEGAACVIQCAAAHPAGKDKYFAVEKCLYCNYCGAACDTAVYCAALDKAPDGGTTDGGDASTDASSDATSDATSDAASDGATEASSDGATEASSDSGDSASD